MEARPEISQPAVRCRAFPSSLSSWGVCPPRSALTPPGPPTPSCVVLLHTGPLLPVRAPRVHVKGTGLCSLHHGPGLAASSSGHWRLGSASHCPGDSHLCACLWGAALSPGRARGCCISATLRGSPSSWPLSLQLGSRGQGSVGRACPEPQPPTPSGNPLLLKSQRQLGCISGVAGWSTHPQPPAPSTERGMEASSGPASAGRRSHRYLPRATVPISQLVLGAGQGTTAAEPAGDLAPLAGESGFDLTPRTQPTCDKGGNALHESVRLARGVFT